MLRKRDPFAPSYKLTEVQRRAICQDPRILELRRAKRELMEEMRSLAGIIKKAQELFPHLYQRHEAVMKELSHLRKALASGTRETARKDYFHSARVLEVDRQIEQLLNQANVEDFDSNNSDDEDWELPVPEYVFPERAQLYENFYGPDAGNFEPEKLLARRIQVTKDLVALNDEEETGNSEASSVAVYLAAQHLIPLPINFPRSGKILSVAISSIVIWLIHTRGLAVRGTCHDLPKFREVTEFLAHAVTVHAYDVKIKKQHLLAIHHDSCSEISSVNNSGILESDSQPDTNTPASSVSSEAANIDPRLFEPNAAILTKLPLRRSKRLRLSVAA
ncbi:hypothetical protein TSTA_012270 [Talaromyces stipitatus ATCC 10500]|uniref:Uncharacterized protein n=1 Tax=Talaromyces stipitatus (strain ATCC 10500 / CBS 375.48 / QM 6759 / NRRL 1006) TaxID=441959 RepID=B8ME41_TALSN|nr:uncharacterized protein TSTA_012270 [Talaromyces stipitatus ATCC 10500]EED16118.1 hypothetical protein TSTA_012270 [Talaromyces stipitatus ATCC 10500]